VNKQNYNLIIKNYFHNKSKHRILLNNHKN